MHGSDIWMLNEMETKLKREKRKTVKKMLMTLFFLFFGCWLPMIPVGPFNPFDINSLCLLILIYNLTNYQRIVVGEMNNINKKKKKLCATNHLRMKGVSIFGPRLIYQIKDAIVRF